MPEAIVDKATCESCGVEVREDTQFCYNCGSRVAFEQELADAAAVESNGSIVPAIVADTATDKEKEMERMFGIKDDPPQDKLAVAAAERKKARLSQRRPRQLVWQSASESTNGLFVFVTLLIAVISAAIVFVAVYLK